MTSPLREYVKINEDHYCDIRMFLDYFTRWRQYEERGTSGYTPYPDRAMQALDYIVRESENIVLKFMERDAILHLLLLKLQLFSNHY